MSSSRIFLQPWWLDTVAPGAWGDATVEKNGLLLARLPFMFEKKYIFTFLDMPPLTQTLGPWLHPIKGKYTNKLSEEKQLLTDLIDQLPKFDYFNQNFHYSLKNWLPFYWKGFQQTTRYTYVIEDLCDLDQVWSETRENIRTDVRKATKQLVVNTELDIDTFLELNELTFKRQGISLPYSRELVYKIEQTCKSRNCRRIMFAEDSKGRLHAAIYIIWDEEAAYYIMGGSDPELRNSGAMSFLTWEAIKFSSGVTKTFDFEGSMIESVERFFRAFGAKQKPYFQVSKINSLPYKIYLDARSWVRMIRDR